MQKTMAENYNPDITVFILRTDTNKVYVGNHINDVIQLLAADWKIGEASKVVSITQIDEDAMEREVIDVA